MKGKATVTRPNRKVTEFFSKKPKPGPRPDQPVYDISSSSDRSIISISSDDIPPRNKSLSRPAPTAGPSARVSSQVASSSRPQGDTRSDAFYISSSSQPSVDNSPIDCNLSSASVPSITRESTRSDGAPVVPLEKSDPVPAMPKNAKKRKQPSVSVISSEESDEPVSPVIRVRQPSRDNATSPRSRSYPSISAVIATSASAMPLSPRQNTLSPSKRTSGKPDTTISLSTVPEKAPEQQHGPSPQKRARHGSSSASDKCSVSTPGDADDEGEGEGEGEGKATSSKPRGSWMTTPIIQPPGDKDPMDVDVPAKSPSLHVPDSDTDDVSHDRYKDIGQPMWKTTPRGDRRDTLPSSQQDEIELGMDHNATAMSDINPPKHPSPVSPSKSRAKTIIARIKAKAEAEAAAQALIERKRSLGLVSSEGDQSDLSSLSSLSDDDDEELEFELSTFGKPSGSGVTKSVAPVSSPDVSSRAPDAIGTRRSTRHENNPAPNYAKRLELFRDDTSPPSKQKEKQSTSAGAQGKPMAPSCPLDSLLRDHEREDARKAKAEKKRKGHASSMRASSPIPNQHSGVFETPSRRRRHAKTESPGSDISEGDVSGEDALMGDAEREELLGKEDAKAVGKILAGDRVKSNREDKKAAGVTFWDSMQEDRKDVVPKLVVRDESSPLLKSLCGAINREDYAAASLLVNADVLAVVPHSVQLLEWLFSTAMSTAHPELSASAYRALLVLQRERSGKEFQTQLNSKVLLASLFKFGVNLQISSLLSGGTSEKTPVIESSRDTKVLTICRFVILLEALGRSRGIESDALPSTILSLLLLALDALASPELQQDVVGAIESLLGMPMVTRAIELGICKSIIHATTLLAYTPEREVQLLALLSGCGASSGRVRRWTAWAMLGGDLSSVNECGDVPPFGVLANLFTDKPTGRVWLNVDRDTDYEALGARVEVLSVALTDVDAYVRQELSAPGASSGGAGSIDGICKALEWMNGQIVDTRAAHLDRTRTKDAINRLHKRLVYQRHATRDLMRGNAGKMDKFVTKTSSNTKSKPKPKPVIARANNREDI